MNFGLKVSKVLICVILFSFSFFRFTYIFSYIIALETKNGQFPITVSPDRFTLYASMLINIRDGLAIRSVIKYKLEWINVRSVRRLSKSENGIFLKNALYCSGSSRVIKREQRRRKVGSAPTKPFVSHLWLK